MKQITNRAVSVLLLAAFVIVGTLLYVFRYVDHGQDWAAAYSRENAGASGALIDRNGVVLASYSPNESLFQEDEELRRANYHVTGDYYGRTGTGLLTDYQDYSLLTGSSRSRNAVLYLNVDSELNRRAWQVLDGRSGAVLVTNYKTGELLCMVSSPTIDPLEAEPDPPEGAYLNRCLAASFVPGSVFKLVTAAAAIEKIPDLNERRFLCEGAVEIAGVEIVCSGYHGEQTFEEALSNSCNVAFSQIAIELGQEAMVKKVRDLGFLDSQRLDGIPTVAGSFPTDFVGDPELGWAGVGQSTDLICPYAMLRYVSAIANDGVLLGPQLVRDGSTGTAERLLKTETAKDLQRLMHYNVVNGYGEYRFPGLALCGKTGTAERGDGSSNAWFVGFLADEEHPYAFVVMIERGGSGLGAAGSAANEILQFAVNR
ncbi:MAG: penicillin-binding protein [Oscillospiraceae bacterium]|nr:penicillin-binding protein [Oscillospiraceae bacterium]